MLRFQLQNEFAGSLIIDRNDPIDINSIVKEIRRSEEYFGIFYEVILDIEFIKKGRKFIKDCYELYGGIDAIVVVNIYELDTNVRRWKLYTTGQINFNKYALDEEKVVVTIEQTGLERKVLNMMEVDVDMETEDSEDGTSLPEQLTHFTPYHSKKILIQFEGSGTEDEVETTIAANYPLIEGEPYPIYFTFPFVVTIDDVAQFKYPFEPSPLKPDEVSKYNFIIPDDGDYVISIPHFPFKATTFFNEPGTWKIEIKIVYGKEGNYTEIELHNETRSIDEEVTEIFEVDPNYSGTIALKKADEFYIYATLTIVDTVNIVDVLSPITVTNFIEPSTIGLISIKGLTTFQETEVKNILIYECFKRCIQHYTNQVDCFYSELLGRTDIGYDEDGLLSLIAMNSGNWLRGRSFRNPDFVVEGEEIGLIFNLKDLLNFVNAITPIGFGFEVVEGKLVFRLEKIQHFFNKDLLAASLGKVYNVKKELVSKMYANQFQSGYSTEIDLKKVNGIDAFNTLRRHVIPISASKNKIDVSTKVNVDGHIIEAQRRLTGTTEDSRYDDQNFATLVLRDGLGYKTKKAEGYAEILGVVDFESGYNYDISPRRNLINHGPVLAGMLIRSVKQVIKFSFGSGNYGMRSRKTSEAVILSERDGLDLTNVVAIWDNEKYILTDVPVASSTIRTIQENGYGYIEFQDQFDETFQGFLMPGGGVKHDSNKKQADFTLLRVHR